jgi:hypothetical protein
MSTPLTSSEKLSVSSLARANACIVFLGGAAGLFGWTTHIQVLYRVSPTMPAMFPWTAVCVLAIGIALLGRIFQNAGGRIMVIGGAGCVIAIMGLILLEYATEGDWGFDGALFPQDIRGTLASHAGRPSIQSATAFLALGLTLFGGLRKEKTPGFSRMIEGLALLAGCIGLMAFFGYAYSVDALFSVPHLKAIGMSPYTAAYVLLACVTTLQIEPTSWTVKTLTRKSGGGGLARLLLPLFILIPLLLGFLRIEAERNGWISHEIGTSLMALAQVLIGAGMLFWLVVTIDRAQAMEKFITMSCVSKKIFHEGQWISVEEFLYKQFNIRISHGMTPQEAKTWLDDGMAEIEREKKIKAET